jgi:hypothetical protein
MAERGNSAHIYRLDDGRFRLTFVYTSPGGASVLNELGDFTRSELHEWLKDHLHPATDVEGMVKSFENQPETTVALGLTAGHYGD